MPLELQGVMACEHVENTLDLMKSLGGRLVPLSLPGQGVSKSRALAGGTGPRGHQTELIPPDPLHPTGATEESRQVPFGEDPPPGPSEPDLDPPPSFLEPDQTEVQGAVERPLFPPCPQSRPNPTSCPLGFRFSSPLCLMNSSGLVEGREACSQGWAPWLPFRCPPLPQQPGTGGQAG